MYNNTYIIFTAPGTNIHEIHFVIIRCFGLIITFLMSLSSAATAVFTECSPMQQQRDRTRIHV